jgi:hypothetical protein
MGLEYSGQRTADWIRPSGTLRGGHLPVSWPLKSGIFFDLHREVVVPSRHYIELSRHVFKRQLPRGVWVEATGDSLIDHLAKDVNSSFHTAGVMTDIYNTFRRSVSSKIAAHVQSEASTEVCLTEQEAFGLSGSVQSAISTVVTYLDILGKYLYLYLFWRVAHIDENTGHRRRSYFREFCTAFYNAETLASLGRCDSLADTLIRHHEWLQMTFHNRDFLQHAGYLNPIVWRRATEYHIDFTGGCHDCPIHPGAILDSVSIATVLHGANQFNEDIKTFIRNFELGFSAV